MLHKILWAFIIVQFHVIAPDSAAANRAGLQLPPATATSPSQDRASRALARALDLMAADDPEGAIQALRPIGASSPNPFHVQRAQCLMAAALAMNGELRSSEEGAGIINNPTTAAGQATWKQALPDCLGRLEGLVPRLAPERRAALYYYLGIIGANESEHIRYLREALKLRPDFSEAAYQLGAHLLGNGQLEEAASMFRRVADQRPEWAEARNNIGVALTLSGRPAEAIREFQEAIKISPEFVEAHGQLGLALYATGDYDGAMTECSRALRGDPDNPLYHHCAAVVLLEKDRPADAAAYARRATQLAPAHETFQVVLAAALYASGQQEQALEVMRRACERMDRMREEVRKKHGILDIGVSAIRELRDEA